MKNNAVKKAAAEMKTKPDPHIERGLKEVSRITPKRLNVEIDEDQHAMMKSIASRHKTTIKAVIEGMIKDYIDSHGEKRR
jgi:hypothetical protein